MSRGFFFQRRQRETAATKEEHIVEDKRASPGSQQLSAEWGYGCLGFPHIVNRFLFFSTVKICINNVLINEKNKNAGL